MSDMTTIAVPRPKTEASITSGKPRNATSSASAAGASTAVVSPTFFR